MNRGHALSLLYLLCFTNNTDPHCLPTTLIVMGLSTAITSFFLNKELIDCIVIRSLI